MRTIVYIMYVCILCSMLSCDSGLKHTQPIDMSKIYYAPQLDLYIKILWKNRQKDIKMYFSKENYSFEAKDPDKEILAYISFTNSRGLISELIFKRNFYTIDTIFIRQDMSTADLFQLAGGRLEPYTIPVPPEYEKVIRNNVHIVRPYDFKFEDVKYIDKNFFVNKKGKGLVLKDNVYILSFYNNTYKTDTYDLILTSNSDTIKLEPL